MKLSRVCSYFRSGAKIIAIFLVVITALMLTFGQGWGALYTLPAGTTESYPKGSESGATAGDWQIDGTLNINAGYSFTFAQFPNTVSATGVVINAGAFYIGNTPNPTTLDSAGTITNSGTLTIVSGSSLINSGTVTNSGPLTNNGSIILTGGILTQQGPATYSGTGSVVFGGAGTLTNNQAAAMNITSLTVNNGITGTINGTGTTTIGTATLNGGTLTNNATGTMTITGLTLNNGFTGTINGSGTTNLGTAMVNGSLNWGGTITNKLSGTGTITGNVTNSGTLAPGNSIGTLTIVGDYTQNAGSTYQVEVNAAGQSDRLVVTGTATLNDGMVSVLAESGNYKMSTLYTILTAAGGVTGTYSGVTSNLIFLIPSLSYDANDVYLTLTRNTTGFADVASTPNQYAVALGLDRASPYALGDMSEIMNNLLGLSAQGARSAYDQMGGLSHVSLEEATFFSFNRYVNTLSGRMASFNTGRMSLAGAENILLAFNEDTGSDAGNMLVAAIRSAKGKEASPWGLWAKGYGNMGDRLGDDIATKYDYHGGGLIVGFDGKMSERLLLGAAVGYSYTKVDMNDLDEDSKVASYQGSLYGAYNIDPWYVNGLIAYGYNRYDTTRDITFGDISRTARADYSGHSLSGYVETGYQITTEAIDIIPMASVQASSLWRNAFTEKDAGALNLDVEKEHNTSLLSGLGFKLKKEYKTTNGVITPEFRARWLHEFADSDYTLNASFTGYPVSTFSVRGDRAQRDSAAVGAGVNWEMNKSFALTLTYDATLSGDRTEHGGTTGIRYRW